MNQLGLVFVAEFLRKVRSRIFIVATIGGALMVALLLEAPALFTHLLDQSTDSVVLAGPPDLRARAATLMTRSKDFHVTAQVDALPRHVTPAYLDKHGKAAAAIAVSVRGRTLHLEVYARDLAAFGDAQFRSLEPLSVALATGAPADRAEAATKVDRTIHGLDAKFADTASAELGHGVAFSLVFILYFAIIIASQSVMASVAEEKTSRIAEILVATISPIDLLAGKTLAAAALALVQVAAWVATGALLVATTADVFGTSSSAPHGAGHAAPVDLSAVDPGVLVAFGVFFVLGYLQYATIYAAAASLISRTEDLGSVTTPVILPVLGAFFVAQYARVAPNAPVSVAFSFLPFFSPFVMFTRIAVASLPGWQIALAIAINVATVVVAFIAAGKVYRVGMLLYGRMPSPRQIWSALRA